MLTPKLGLVLPGPCCGRWLQVRAVLWRCCGTPRPPWRRHLGPGGAGDQVVHHAGAGGARGVGGAMLDLRKAGVDILTLGQYLQVRYSLL